MSTSAEKGKELLALIAKLPDETPSLPIVRALIEEEADLTITEAEGYTALSLAVLYDQFDLTRALLDGGSNIEHKDANGDTPLLLATGEENTEMCSLLLGRKANIHASNADGRTALHIGAGNNFVATCELVVERGADMEAEDNDALTPLDDAVCNGSAAVCELFFEKGAKVDPTLLLSAASQGHTDVCALLLFKGANISVRGSEDWTPLHHGASGGFTNLCRFLMLCGCDASVKNKEGKTALDFARANNHSATVAMLEGVQDLPPAPPVQALGKRKREVDAVDRLTAELEKQKKKTTGANDAVSKLKKLLAEKSLALKEAEKTIAEANPASAVKGGSAKRGRPRNDVVCKKEPADK